MNTNSKYKLIVVDDNCDFLASIGIFLEREASFEIIGMYSNPSTFLESEKISFADIIILDIEMPEINGINLAKKILRQDSEKKLMALTTYKEQVYLSNFIETGFKGCVYKDEVYFNLKPAIKTVLKGEVYF